MLIISELFIYPIKSLGGISVSAATLTDRGFEYDRRWMLVDKTHQFLSQRSHPQMALLQVEIQPGCLHVHHTTSGETISIALVPQTNETVIASIWDDCCEVQFVDESADKWFSKMLLMPCRLVYMPDKTLRKVDEEYALQNDLISLADDFPLLIIGQASLDDLNGKLKKPLPMNRFRPNIVFKGGFPYQEDVMKQFSINQTLFYGVKLCGRCAVTTINQLTAFKSLEPLKTLATYRAQNNKVNFGQNLIYKGSGTIKVGDSIVID